MQPNKNSPKRPPPAAHWRAGFLLLIALPWFALAQQPALLPPAIEARIVDARATGYWIVQEGEHLYRICRYFTADERQTSDLAKEVLATNSGAFVQGNPGRLIVGARLKLPQRLLAGVPAKIPPASARPDTAASSPSSGPDAAHGQGPASDPLPSSLRGKTADAAPPAAAAYVDQLIDGVDALAEESIERTRARDDTPGLRSTVVEYRGERRDSNAAGMALTQGIALQHRRETELYGDLSIDAELGYEHTAPSQIRDSGTRGKATLYHENFAIGESIVANSAFGVTRLSLAPWMASSYRVTLPTTLIAGANALITTPSMEWRGGIGRIGRLFGSAVQDFEYTGGSSAMLSVAGRVSGNWIVGIGAAAVKDSPIVPDNTTLTFGTEFALPDSGALFKLQGLADDDGHKGLWADGQHRTGRLFHRFGGYQMDPGLQFGEATPQRDIRGLYWRGDYRLGPDYMSMGVDATQTNLDRDPSRGGSTNVGLTASVTLKIDRKLSVGGGLTLRDESPRTSTGEGRKVALANAFVSRSSGWGYSRLDATLNRTRPDTGLDESIRTLSWTQDWPRIAAAEINTLLTLTDESLAERRVRRASASLALRGPIAGSLRWDASATFVNVDDGEDSERNYNSNIGIEWSPAASWLLRLHWQRNAIQPTADNPLSPFLRENVLELTARWEDFRGTPYPGVGIAGGRSATGQITGSVFFDENGDGVRQPTERGAGSVTVVLDGRRAETTDADGRFAFSLVPVGERRVAVLLERIPLPWGLEDESPRPVRVELRGASSLEVGLTRISP